MGNPRTSVVLAACLALLAGCAGGEDNPPTDSATDTDVPSDTTETTGDAADTEEEEDAPPVDCAGSETLNLEFLDPDEAPIEGVEVALECGDMHVEATSGTDGIASFTDLNLSGVTVDFTYVHDGRARTWIDVGGPSRTLPDPLSLTIGRAESDPMVTMEGELVHAATDSLMLLTTVGGGIDLTRDVRYSLDTFEGTGLTMYVIEWTSTGTTGTPVGYQVLTYDSPTGGADGPVVGPTDSTLLTTTLTINFNIATDSTILDAELPTDTPFSNRLIAGARCVGEDTDENFIFFGLTTNWSGGFSAPTLDVAWIPDGLTDVAEFMPSLWLVDPDHNSWAIFQLPDTAPEDWSTFTVNDAPPKLGGLDMGDTVPFDYEIMVERPTWTAEFLLSYHIRWPHSSGAIFQDHYQWSVVTHPETTSLRFSDLPWPESVDIEDVLNPAVNHRFGMGCTTYDADPYADYALWADTTDTWAETHYLVSFGDSRYLIENP